MTECIGKRVRYVFWWTEETQECTGKGMIIETKTVPDKYADSKGLHIVRSSIRYTVLDNSGMLLELEWNEKYKEYMEVDIT